MCCDTILKEKKLWVCQAQIVSSDSAIVSPCLLALLIMLVVQVLVLLQLHVTFYKDCVLSLGSEPSRSLAQSRGTLFKICFIQLNQPILLKSTSKHFYVIIPSSR